MEFALFRYDGSQWVEERAYQQRGMDDRFGAAVALSREYVLVGATHTAISGNDYSGAAYFLDIDASGTTEDGE